MLYIVDDALHSATRAQKMTLKNVDENFSDAIDALSGYEERHHPNARTDIAERMRTAEDMDTSSLKYSNWFKENRNVREVFALLFRGCLLY